jgi:hypothetical protein
MPLMMTIPCQPFQSRAYSQAISNSSRSYLDPSNSVNPSLSIPRSEHTSINSIFIAYPFSLPKVTSLNPEQKNMNKQKHIADHPALKSAPNEVMNVSLNAGNNIDPKHASAPIASKIALIVLIVFIVIKFKVKQ